MKVTILVLLSMLAYTYGQSCSSGCAQCDWTCQANVTMCVDNSTSCTGGTANGTCTASCSDGSGSPKMELVTSLLFLGILASLCFYP